MSLTLARDYHIRTPTHGYSRESVFDHLRKQYLRRALERNPLGSDEEPIQWATLGLSQKVSNHRSPLFH